MPLPRVGDPAFQRAMVPPHEEIHMKKRTLLEALADLWTRRAHTRFPRRVAHIHVMKTAGSFVESYLGYQVLAKRGYRIHNSYASGRQADWTREELERFRVTDTETAMHVHNHVGNWPADVVRSYLEDGWFVFSFTRHPGDQWCSCYYWAKKQPHGFWTTEMDRVFGTCSLDEFLRLGFGPGGTLRWFQHGLAPPSYWRTLHFVDEYSDESFAWMLDRYFGHRFLRRTKHRVNASDNPGYARCLAEGLVSESTDRLIRASEQFATYEEIVAAARARRSGG